MGTMFPKTGEVSRDWWVVDLSGQTLGRAASQIASLLRGKHKTIFSSHVDTGDFVVVINAEKVAMTGRKLDQKHYHSHSGFLGSIKSVPARQMLADKPEVVIPLDHAPAAGEKLTVEIVLTMRLLYMQIMPGVDGGPGRYVTNRVPVEREVVLA